MIRGRKVDIIELLPVFECLIVDLSHCRGENAGLDHLTVEIGLNLSMLRERDLSCRQKCLNTIEHGIVDAVHRKCEHVVLEHDLRSAKGFVGAFHAIGDQRNRVFPFHTTAPSVRIFSKIGAFPWGPDKSRSSTTMMSMRQSCFSSRS
ncbi:MAG: hypothetical protein BWX99_03003 [Deltaproteobacteria bacterium ADurb.Bin151]|nr:MAG: hypothetical protein BWX99_03003 [Deltaproteobacteria bacterium ADurb.Bin151]